MSGTTANDELRAYIEKKRGRPLTLAERNIDIAALDADLKHGKARLQAAIAEEQKRTIDRWVRGGMRGTPRVRATAAIEKVLADLYEVGRTHGEAELRRAGYRGYAAAGGDGGRLKKLRGQLTTFLGGLNQRIARTITSLDLGEMSATGIATALAGVPGALDVASRMISQSIYAGLGAAFDKAAGQVDAQPTAEPESGATSGGNGWEYTAVMDGGTCDPCAAADGTTYDTWDEAQADLPDGGPNPDCDGETRCRCRLAPVPL